MGEDGATWVDLFSRHILKTWALNWRFSFILHVVRVQHATINQLIYCPATKLTCGDVTQPE